MSIQRSSRLGLPHALRLSGAIALLLLLIPGLARAERVELDEPVTDPRVFHVEGRLEVTGQLQTPTKDGKAVALKLTVNANWNYYERRLPGLGRDAEAFRSVRKYNEAAAKIQVAEQTSNPRLRPAQSLIVAEGRREGIRYFSPSGPLTSTEQDLLDTEADSLAALALLPDDPVDVGDEWKPREWVLQFLVGVEAVEKTSLKCRLESIKDGLASVIIEGEIVGGILGSATEIKVSGHYTFDVGRHYLSRLELTLAEKRSVGAVSPGTDVTARVHIERVPEDFPGLSEKSLAEVPLEPNQASLLLSFEPPGLGARCYYDRNWHLFHSGRNISVLRLLDKGSLIAQCNISPLDPAEPGKHMPEEQFKRDVERALGKDFRQILQADVVPTDGKQFIYRVTAAGETRQETKDGQATITPIQWMYYLVASPTGQQVVLAFTVEAQLLDRLGTQDLALASSIEFLNPSKSLR